MAVYDLNVDGEQPIDGAYWITIHLSGRPHVTRFTTCRDARYWVRKVREADLKRRVTHEAARMGKVCGRHMDVRFCASCGGGRA